jgi:hypothetical protein
MQDLPRVSPPSVSPEALIRPADPIKLSTWSRLKVPIIAALGAAVGPLIFRGLYSQERGELLQLAIIAVIAGTAAYWFFDPVLEWIRRSGSIPEKAPQQRSFVTTSIIVGATILIS